MLEGSYWEARVGVVVGDRRKSKFLANAGLGITGVGEKETWVIRYGEREEVDIARVEKAMEMVKNQLDAEGADMQILSFAVEGLSRRPSQTPNT